MIEYLMQLSHEVEQIYHDMGEAFSTFQQSSQLTCKPSCGQCCQKNGIEATMLEMLPLAMFIWQSGQAFETLTQLDAFIDAVEKNQKKGCFFFSEQQFCTVYQQRPTVCRAFGAYVRRNKMNLNEVVVCKLIKESVNVIPIEASEGPHISSFSQRVNRLDSLLGSTYYPINTALKLMLEKILFYEQFKDCS